MQPMMQPVLQPMQPTLRYVTPQPMPVPAPAPVPAPVRAPVFPQQQPQYDPYDQSFFIGTPQPLPNNFPVQSQISPVPFKPVASPTMNSPLAKPMNFPTSVANTPTSTVISKKVEVTKKVDLTLPKQHLKKPETKEDILKVINLLDCCCSVINFYLFVVVSRQADYIVGILGYHRQA